MKYPFSLSLLLLLFCITVSCAQETSSVKTATAETNTSISDGPYIFIERDRIVEKSIVNNEVITKALKSKAYETNFPPAPSVITTTASIAALSDIHGQYDLAVEILQNNGIIDKNGHWAFGDGHFVIVGDIFDRGDGVTEMLWLIYTLEQQAAAQGGRVHFLLGNHEYMVLHKDLRYLHEKYTTVLTMLDLDYDTLYGENTVLGRWLRAKPTVLKINDHIFVHGGISKQFLELGPFDPDAINATMRASIARTKEEMKATDFYNNYYGSSGPIWYRGYFYDDLPDEAISEILQLTNSEQIVVGHCSNKEVVSLYDNRIFGVDSSIKLGEYGELLFIENGSFYRATKDGTRIKFE
ncbi:metallophosphoesterase [Constantimarinum furrinae]|uniref:Metallophosphoesterase n=1 Tax=Constantimarinum furrinae TaxID=2562285 RepID=A0A7G8PXD7_9FLAO|nr:metallophosphoesterase [Constantimarinum furrinae]QNJ99003.1 Metallophosphoesterase [Constantimarinum furrinae]